MKQNQYIVAYRVGVSLLVLVAVWAQLLHGISSISGFHTANFFSFFTIQSNLLGALALLVASSYLSRGKTSAWADNLRGASAFFMLMTGVIYTLLLANADVQTPIPWVNFVLHYLFPIVMLLDWVLIPPKKLPTLRQSSLWLIYPVLYVVYSLIRGAVTGWYPYPFLSVSSLGLWQVILNSIAIGIGVVILSPLFAWLPRVRRAK